MNWRNSHEACEGYRRLDKKHLTPSTSPLHHDYRCPIHATPIRDNPMRTIPLILAPPAAKRGEPVCGETARDQSEGGGLVTCSLRPHGRGQLHVAHGVTYAVTWQ